MSATLELKYFNSFWLKKMKQVVQVQPTIAPTIVDTATGGTITFDVAAVKFIGVGQEVVYTLSDIIYYANIEYIDNSSLTETVVTISPAPVVIIPSGTDINFGEINDFKHVPAAYEPDVTNDWFIEEARIRGGYNNTSVDFGVKAYIVELETRQQHRANSMIYSGVLNSRTGINKTNEFSVGEDITRSVDPINGSIQKLYAEDTNLIIFQERKVNNALIDKSAVYTAEGMPMQTSGNIVIGQVRSYAGNYGIGTNPESFSVYGYRKYFADKTQNSILRLSQDGLTEISQYGMVDFFRDNLSALNENNRIVGGWDIVNKQYVISMQADANYNTLVFDEDCNGWVSRYTYNPEQIFSIKSKYYTIKNGKIWEHYSTAVSKGSFYNTVYDASAQLVFNPEASAAKSFNTINYEGTIGWALDSIYTDSDQGIPITYATASNQLLTLAAVEAQLFINNFKNKENKYFANIINNTAINAAEILNGQQISGIKGYYVTARMKLDNSLFGTVNNTKSELFAVSLNYSGSSY